MGPEALLPSKRPAGFSPFLGHTCSGDRCRCRRPQVADLEEEPHRGVQGDPLVARQGQHLDTGRDTPGRKEGDPHMASVGWGSGFG